MLLVLCPIERKLDEQVLSQSKDSVSGIGAKETQMNLGLSLGLCCRGKEMLRWQLERSLGPQESWCVIMEYCIY